MPLHVHLREGFKVAEITKEFRLPQCLVRMAELDMPSQLASFLIVFRANMTHVRQKFGVFMQHQVVVHSSGSLRLVLANPTLEFVVTMDGLEVLVLHFPLVEYLVAQVAFEDRRWWLSL